MLHFFSHCLPSIKENVYKNIYIHTGRVFCRIEISYIFGVCFYATYLAYKYIQPNHHWNIIQSIIHNNLNNILHNLLFTPFYMPSFVLLFIYKSFHKPQSIHKFRIFIFPGKQFVPFFFLPNSDINILFVEWLLSFFLLYGRGKKARHNTQNMFYFSYIRFFFVFLYFILVLTLDLTRTSKSKREYAECWSINSFWKQFFSKTFCLFFFFSYETHKIKKHIL